MVPLKGSDDALVGRGGGGPVVVRSGSGQVRCCQIQLNASGKGG